MFTKDFTLSLIYLLLLIIVYIKKRDPNIILGLFAIAIYVLISSPLCRNISRVMEVFAFILIFLLSAIMTGLMAKDKYNSRK